MNAPDPSDLRARVRQLRLPLLLLFLVPIAPVLHYLLDVRAAWIFGAGALAIAVLADWVRRATEQVATRAGPAIGGLLNVSFGSIAELILALFVLADGKVDVVRAQITGSIIGTGLLGLGIAIVAGSIGRRRQRFNRSKASQLSTLLILCMIALLLPAVFDFTGRYLTQEPVTVPEEQLSLGVSMVLIALYAANLIYTLITHRDVFASKEPREKEGADRWSIWLSVGVLVLATTLIAWQAELVSSALDETSKAFSLSPVFVGVIVLALVGTASDLFAAAFFARAGKMNLVFNICVGSAIQVALVVAPLLVIGSWLMGQPMTLVFRNPLNLFAIASAVLTVNAISADGEATWFEGVLLIGVYVLLGLAFYFTAPIA